jgi:oxaloacetate decarboxylase beta subunit
MNSILENIYGMTAISDIVANPGFIVMYLLAFVLLYLGIKKEYEPLLLIPIAFGVLIANFPGGGMGVNAVDGEGIVTLAVAAKDLANFEIGHCGVVDIIQPATDGAKGLVKFDIWNMTLPAIAHELGLMNFIYYMLIKTGFIPPIIFMGVGALTDFGPMLRNLKLAIFGAGAQFGIFAVLLIAAASGQFTMKEAASLLIIGGADGPIAIFTTIKLAPHMLGPIAIAAYSYMALVPVIIPLVVKLLCSEKELKINMKEQDKLYPSGTEFKNMRALKILFPIAVTVIVAILVPSAVSLVGMLMFGNLIKEIGANTSRIFDAASNSIMNAATIFLGLSVGATMTVEAFLNLQTIGIVIGGFFAFGLSIAGGICLVKIYNLIFKKKINPLIGATGLSAVPMASRVANDIALKYDSRNHVLNYCMSSNVSGVIGSAVAAGILISFLG